MHSIFYFFGYWDCPKKLGRPDSYLSLSGTGTLYIAHIQDWPGIQMAFQTSSVTKTWDRGIQSHSNT